MSLDAINATNKNHKAVRAAAKAAEGARLRRAAAVTLQATFKMKRQQNLWKDRQMRIPEANSYAGARVYVCALLSHFFDDITAS